MLIMASGIARGHVCTTAAMTVELRNSPILVFVFASNYLKIIAGTTQQLMTQRSSGYVLALRLHG